MQDRRHAVVGSLYTVIAAIVGTVAIGFMDTDHAPFWFWLAGLEVLFALWLYYGTDLRTFVKLKKMNPSLWLASDFSFHIPTIVLAAIVVLGAYTAYHNWVRRTKADLPESKLLVKEWMDTRKTQIEMRDSVDQVFPFATWSIEGFTEPRISMIRIFNGGIAMSQGKSSITSHAIHSLKATPDGNDVLVVSSSAQPTEYSDPPRYYWFLKRTGAEEYAGAIVHEHGVDVNVRLTKWTDPYEEQMEQMLKTTRGDTSVPSP